MRRMRFILLLVLGVPFFTCIASAQGELGVVGTDLSYYVNYWRSQGYADYQLDFGVNQGAIIDLVKYGGGAHRAGLAQYDVIVAVNGKKITIPSDINAAIGQRTPGSTVTVTYYRQKRKYTTSVVLQAPANRNDYYVDYYSNYYTYDQVAANYGLNNYNNQWANNNEEYTEHPKVPKKPEPKVKQEEKQTVVQSDVDVKIPVGKARKDDEVYCVIIANEDYKEVAPVEFAAHDGEVFKEYCIKVLGVPEKHISIHRNATYGQFAKAIDFLAQRADITDGRAQLIFYYAGHGMPSEKDNTAYIIPVDGDPKILSTCLKLSDIYSQLGKMKSQSTMVLLDACFSGMKRGDDGPIVAARGIAIKPKKESLNGNMIVLSAASDDEMAHAYKEKGHGMFTYFLLKKLRDSKGNSSLGELYDYISQQVKKSSLDENNKRQTPSVTCSPSLQDSWRDLKLK